MAPPRRDDAGRQPGEVGKTNGSQSLHFATSNPRHQRALSLLLKRPAKREELDRTAGCSNFPDLAAELRRRGLKIPCLRVAAYDRDGQKIRIGVYLLTDADRRAVSAWLRKRDAKGAA